MGCAEWTVVLGFDMETDIGSWTPFYEGLVHGTPRMLDVLDETGTTGTFFFVGQAAKDHPRVVRQVGAAGHEIGCHSLYHETVGVSLVQIPGGHDLLPHEVEPRLRLATQWVEEAGGTRPVSFRCPRLFGSTSVCLALESMGYTADASLPMYHYTERRVPYHPSRQDWTQPGDLKLVQIPNFADLTIDSRDPLGRDRDQWPLFRTQGADALMRHVENFAGYCESQKQPAVLCFYFHPWEFWPMPQGLIRYGEGAVQPDPFIVENCGDVAVKELKRLIVALKDRGTRFLTAAQCAQEWA